MRCPAFHLLRDEAKEGHRKHLREFQLLQFQIRLDQRSSRAL